MDGLQKAGDIQDIWGQTNTNVGNMLQRIKEDMAKVSREEKEKIRITDILAVDTMAPVVISGSLAGETCMEKAVGIAAMVKTCHLPMQQIARITDILAVDTMAPVVISGSLAGETCMEKAVGIAAMVKTCHLPMQQIADKLGEELQIQGKVAGVEAVMASLGALTTPGTQLPLAILDMGGGSTDAALLREDGTVETTHQAGAGELVSMLIQTELGLQSRNTAEQIKKYPLAKVESLFHMRLENGAMEFFQDSIDPRYYGHVVLLAPGELLKIEEDILAKVESLFHMRLENGAMEFFQDSIDPRYYGHVVLLAPGELLKIEEDIPMEKIRQVRREAKKKVFVTNAVRALKKVAPEHNLKKVPNVVLVGGSAEDFEIPEMLTEALAEYRIVCGRGNIRGQEGPRNAVATGLLLSCLGQKNREENRWS